MFCHYMLSSGGLVGRFCPMVQLASAIHLAAGGSLSRLRFERLGTCSFQPRSKVPPQDRQFWPPKRGSKSKAQNQAAFIGLHCAVAVELLLTGDQHKPCASFNQEACKNTTSVAEGKRKTPQKIASKGAKICKKMSPFWGPKMDPFWGLPLFF